MASSGILRRVALVRTDLSEELSATFIRVTRIGELGTTKNKKNNKQTNSVAFSPQANYTDSHLSAKFSANFCG
jgi:hypothetical protein